MKPVTILYKITTWKDKEEQENVRKKNDETTQTHQPEMLPVKKKQVFSEEWLMELDKSPKIIDRNEQEMKDSVEHSK